MALLPVRVTPKSGSDSVTGVISGELQVRVRSAPEDGKANTAVCRTVADFLGIPKSRVSVSRGGSSRHKMLEIEGLSSDELSALLEDLLAEKG